MNSWRETALLFLILLAIGTGFTKILLDELTPAPEVTRPKQPHYAVFYSVCGTLRLVLLTTDPPTLVWPDKQVPPATLKLMSDIPPERIIQLRYQGSECFLPAQSRKVYQ